MKRFFAILFLSLPCLMWAQNDVIYHIPDTTSGADSDYRYYVDLTRQPDALKAVWLGAILPGAGQIYNGSYWKLPIVYGGLMGCGYAISFNQSRYNSYKTAYRDLYNDAQAGLVTNDPAKSYNAILPEGYDIDRLGGVSKYTSTLQNWQSTHRRYRDWSIVATIVVYALSLVDAYVDAQLFDFDISPDLTLNVEPQIYYDLQQQRSAEVKLAITF